MLNRPEGPGEVDTKVSIVIITKDTKELLENLLQSIKKDLSLQPLIGKIIIIDNASADTTEEMVKEKFPAVVYARNEKNMGFAFSVNKGASLAEGEYVLFLNSDTVVMAGELVKMISFMDSSADAAICGPQLVYHDMRPQRSYAVVPSLSGEFFFRRGLKTQRARLNAQDSTPENQVHDSPFPVHSALTVDSLIGAAILVRKNILTTINGFDERFFFFLEETDLCVRVRRIGYKVVFFPDARIIHLQGKTVRKSWIKGRIEYNISLRKFIKKHHEPIYYSAFVAIRFIKTLFSVVLFPLVFFGRRMRIKYVYYLMLLKWYLKGCPDDMGLRGR